MALSESLSAQVKKAQAESPDGPVARAELMQEIDEKLARVQQYLEREEAGGLLITQVRNFSWITAGLGDNHIVITGDVGAASLLIMRNGKKYVIATNSEIPRLMAEDLNGLGYEPVESKWYEGRVVDDIKKVASGQTVLSDTAMADFRVVDITPLRTPLTDSELKKYRWLGRQSTEAVIATINQLKPGLTERQIEAITSNELMRRGIRPTVLLIGTDDRIYSFRHATPTDTATLEKYGMVNICARKWGLVIAVTRFVHFGPMPPELKKRVQAAAVMNARFQANSRPGAVAGDLFEMAKKWYAEQGFPGEWEKHHQGGAIGYGERDWVITPGGKQVVVARQGFAWNPTIMGGKMEDTVIAHTDRIENITETPGWPVIKTSIEGRTYVSPDVLVKRAGFAKR